MTVLRIAISLSVSNTFRYIKKSFSPILINKNPTTSSTSIPDKRMVVKRLYRSFANLDLSLFFPNSSFLNRRLNHRPI